MPQLSNQIPQQMHQMQGRKPTDSMMLGQPGAGAFPGSRNPTPTQFLTQSPTQGVQSPAGLGSGSTAGSHLGNSPALVPSPSSQMSKFYG